MENSSTLPIELSQEAVLHGQEYAWSMGSFRNALKLAPTLKYACLGGQFWILPAPGQIYELFWLEANSAERIPGEPWSTYTSRSCSEVSEQFEQLLVTVDFREEVLKFRTFKDYSEPPVFNAYFVTEQEWANLQPHS